MFYLWLGPERKFRIPDEETNLITAYHEAGHTLVAYFTKDATALHKVTIIPRGQSLGHVSFFNFIIIAEAEWTKNLLSRCSKSD